MIQIAHFVVTLVGKNVRRKNSWTTEGLSSFEYGGGGSILRLAEMRHDERLLRSYDLFAFEAKYHQSCRDKYNDPEKWRSQNYDLKNFRNEKEESRDMGFSKLCGEVIDRKIVIGKEVLTLIDLRDTYGFAVSKHEPSDRKTES